MFEKVLNFLTTKEVYSEKEVYYTPTLAGNIALFILIALLFVLMAAFARSKKQLLVKQLAFSAMGMTLAVITSLIPLARLPYGGSITLLSMFFICLIGYLFGAKAGILTGIAYGFLNLFLDPTVMHPIQMLLDYPIAYGFLGLTGVFSKSKFGMIKGYALGVFGRYLCHVISGYVFFSMYAPDGWSPIAYTLWYNASYIVPEAIITIILLFVPQIQNALKTVKRMVVQEA